MSCDPCGRSEFSNALDGGVSESWQDVGEIVADGYLKPAATFDDRQDRRHARSSLFAADVDPVFSAQRYAAHRVFRKVVAKFQFRIFEEDCQPLP